MKNGIKLIEMRNKTKIATKALTNVEKNKPLLGFEPHNLLHTHQSSNQYTNHPFVIENDFFYL